MKIMDYTSLQHLISEIKNRYVVKDGTKVLTDVNFSQADKDNLDAVNTKASGIENGAQINVIEEINRNGTKLVPTGKSVNIDVPVKLSDLTNDMELLNRQEVIQLVADHGKLKKSVVDDLPSEMTADENTIYLVAKTAGDPRNGFNEYMLIQGEWELIGDTQGGVDLTGYIKEEDLIAITLEDITSAFI